MKKTINNLTILFTLIFIGACTKQDLSLEVIEKACRNFKIEQPSYERLNPTSSCTDVLNHSYEVTFTFNEGDDCIHLIKNEPTFYDPNNNEISNVTFRESILKSDVEVTVSGNSITYVFEVEFANMTDAANFNHLVLKFHTENENEDASNDLEIRVNAPCSVVNPGTYDVNPNSVVVPPSSFFTITVWDNAAEDGDIISVYLNGTWITENHTLTNFGTSFSVPTSLLVSGSNDLVVFALNEGSSGPNTVSIAINGDKDNPIDGFNPGLLTGEAVRINF